MKTFGLANFGALMLRRRSVCILVIAAVGIASLLNIHRLAFDGDLAEILRSDSDVWHEFAAAEADFGNPSRSLVIHVGGMPGKIEDLRGTVLDLALTDGVDRVWSIFSLRTQRDGGGPLLPRRFDDPETGLPAILNQHPIAQRFVSPDGKSAIVLVRLAPDGVETTLAARQTVDTIRAIFTKAGLDVLISGRIGIEAAITEALINDLWLVVAASVVIGLVVAVVVFGQLRAVLVVNTSAITAMFWTFGFLGVAGLPLDTLTIILPMLASVIAFADAVHLVQHRLDADGPDAGDRVQRRIGPATALTSITTVVAFASIALAGGRFVDFAIAGMGAVALAWLAAMTVVPLLDPLLGAAARASGKVHGQRRTIGFRLGRWLVAIGNRTGLRGPVAVTIMSAAMLAVLIPLQFGLPVGHRLIDYLPAKSDARLAETRIAQEFGGSGQIIVIFDLAEGGGVLTPPDKARLASAHNALADAVGARRVFSRHLFGGADLDFGDISKDGQRISIGIQTDLGWTDATLTATEHTISKALQQVDSDIDWTITGYPILGARQAPDSLQALRQSLLLTVFVTALIVGLSTRSPAMAISLAVSVSVCVLSVLALSGLVAGRVEFSMLVALVIAIGIAVDDGIHLLNLAGSRPDWRDDPRQAIAHALRAAAPALVVSTVILCATLLILLFTQLPALATIGLGVISALAIALLSTVIVLPAVLLVLLNWLK